MKDRNKTVIGIVLALALWVVILLFLGLLTGCEQRYEEYLAVRFEAFNEAVQGGLEDCRADPNACRPTLELMAGELEIWTDIMTDPNL